MQQENDKVEKYTTDMLGVLRHISQAVERHCKDDHVRGFPSAKALLDQVRQQIDRQRSLLEAHIESHFGARVSMGVKDAVTSVTGFLTGLYGQVRTEEVSKILRDDITAVHFATTCYSMLSATALAFNDKTTSELASRSMRELTPLVMELGKTIPQVVIEEFAQEGMQIDRAVIQESVRQLENAWLEPSNSEASSSIHNSRAV